MRTQVFNGALPLHSMVKAMPQIRCESDAPLLATPAEHADFERSQGWIRLQPQRVLLHHLCDLQQPLIEKAVAFHDFHEPAMRANVFVRLLPIVRVEVNEAPVTNLSCLQTNQKSGSHRRSKYIFLTEMRKHVP